MCARIREFSERRPIAIRPLGTKDVVKNWMRSRATISFLGLLEKLHNPDFKGGRFRPPFENGCNQDESDSASRFARSDEHHLRECEKFGVPRPEYVTTESDVMGCLHARVAQPAQGIKLSPAQKKLR